MLKSFALAALTVAAASLPLHAAELTPQETRWLRAAAPVLNYAKQIALPVDVVV